MNNTIPPGTESTPGGGVAELRPLLPIHRERTDARGERTDHPLNLVSLGAGHDQKGRMKPREIGFISLQTDDRVVRGRVGDHPGDNLSILAANHIPERTLPVRADRSGGHRV